MTASRLRPSRPTDKWQHRLSSRTPTGTELVSRQLIQSANRNPVESNEAKSNNKTKDPRKEKQTLDTSDLLIENALLFCIIENCATTLANDSLLLMTRASH